MCRTLHGSKFLEVSLTVKSGHESTPTGPIGAVTEAGTCNAGASLHTGASRPSADARNVSQQKPPDLVPVRSPPTQQIPSAMNSPPGSPGELADVRLIVRVLLTSQI